MEEETSESYPIGGMAEPYDVETEKKLTAACAECGEPADSYLDEAMPLCSACDYLIHKV